MIQLGIRFFLLVLCFSPVPTLCAQESSMVSFYDTNKEALFSKTRFILLGDVVFAPPKCDAPLLQQALRNSLAKVGKVEKIKGPKQKVDALLLVTLNQIAEDSLKKNVVWKNFPIVQISFQLQAPSFLEKDRKLKLQGLLWQSTRFVNLDQENFNAVLEKNIDQMVGELNNFYLKAKTTPIFLD